VSSVSRPEAAEYRSGPLPCGARTRARPYRYVGVSTVPVTSQAPVGLTFSSLTSRFTNNFRGVSSSSMSSSSSP
jgi:hypothetical protein